MDRSWAVGLPQIEFEREYLKRCPGADVIPFGEEWAVGSEPVYRHIDAPHPEDYQPDGPGPPETDKRKIAGQFICEGCKRVFGFRLALAGHKRGCSEIKAMKAKQEVLA